MIVEEHAPEKEARDPFAGMRHASRCTKCGRRVKFPDGITDGVMEYTGRFGRLLFGKKPVQLWMHRKCWAKSIGGTCR